MAILTTKSTDIQIIPVQLFTNKGTTNKIFPSDRLKGLSTIGVWGKGRSFYPIILK